MNVPSTTFINAHKEDDLATVSLLLSKQSALNKAFILAQINGMQKGKSKLPSYSANSTILYPSKLSLEQCSSEKTAVYKSKLVIGKTLLDLTGGFGVDSFYFSRVMDQVSYIEPNQELYNIVKHNFEALNAHNVEMHNTLAENFIKKNTQKFDVVYIDPSRRNQHKRVYQLDECTPNILELAPQLFQFSTQILVKTAPLLDIKQALKDLKNVCKVWVVSVHNDCKEVLYLLKKDFIGSPSITAVNLAHEHQKLTFTYAQEQTAEVVFSAPLNYLYEPNASLLKAGAFNSICHEYGVKKIAPHSHLYTSDKLVENFPGRQFRIEHLLPYNTKATKQLQLSKANVSCRNFKNTVAQVKQKLKLKDGGKDYLFATTDAHEKPLLIMGQKI